LIVLAMGIWTELHPASFQVLPPTAGRRSDAAPLQPVCGPTTPGLGAWFAACSRKPSGRWPRQTPQAHFTIYKGWRLMALDGTVEILPDSKANAAAFGYPEGGHRGRGARPQIRKLSLVEVGTHFEVALTIKGIKHLGERTMVHALLRHLCPEMLLLWDRGFFSYALWKTVIATGAASCRLILRPLTSLDDGSYIAKLYPCESERNKDRHGSKCVSPSGWMTTPRA